MTGWAWTSLVASIVHLDWRLLAIGRVSATLTACALLMVLCRRAAAADRHALWAVGLGGALVLTLGGLATAPGPLATRSVVDAWWIAAWGIGAAAVGGRTLLGIVLTSRLRRRAQPIVDTECRATLERIASRLRLRSAPTLLESAEVATPLTFGWRRPVVLLPAGARTWPAERLCAVLVHELSHVARSDWLHRLADHLTCALYWFHPLVHWAARRRRIEAERACDEAVLAAGVQPVVYATLLVDLASTAVGSHQGIAIAFTVSRYSELEERVRGVLHRDSPTVPWTFAMAAPALVLIGAASLAVSSVPTACPLTGAARPTQSGIPATPGVAPASTPVVVR